MDQIEFKKRIGRRAWDNWAEQMLLETAGEYEYFINAVGQFAFKHAGRHPIPMVWDGVAGEWREAESEEEHKNRESVDLFKTPDGEVLCYPCAAKRGYLGRELVRWTRDDWTDTVDQDDDTMRLKAGPSACQDCGISWEG